MKSQLPKLVFATHNAGKLAEMRSLLAGTVGELVSAAELGLASPAETGADFTENARLKAEAAGQATGLPTLADDSGLCVHALNDAPGLYSAWWAGPQQDFAAAMRQIENLLRGHTDRRAHFHATLMLRWPDGRELIAEGRVEGTIIWPPRGRHGHGYDPIFQPAGYQQTFAELGEATKNTLSHRARAVENLQAALRKI